MDLRNPFPSAGGGKGCLVGRGRRPALQLEPGSVVPGGPGAGPGTDGPGLESLVYLACDNPLSMCPWVRWDRHRDRTFRKCSLAPGRPLVGQGLRAGVRFQTGLFLPWEWRVAGDVQALCSRMG